jgi:N-acetylmuramoyl-L-alanine amidase
MHFEQIAQQHHINYIKCIEDGVTQYKVLPFQDPYRNHFDQRNISSAAIQFLIFHYTELNFHDTCEVFTNNTIQNRVSAHYVVPEHSCEYVRFVSLDQRAWHAGVSAFGSHQNLNDTSIGIEVVNAGLVEKNIVKWQPFDIKQIDVCGTIAQHIVKNYHIKPQHVLGHSDIAPTRKKDPGPLFPWGYLYKKYGVGAWLDTDEMDVAAIQKKYHPQWSLPPCLDVDFFITQLQVYGYSVNSHNYPDCLMAFKAHFCENGLNQQMSKQLTYDDMFWIWALNSKYS